ncbi:hypothetical protein K435DRAFT_799864 [Dendrothele bispora CBS 962.96]|uniref:Uncharacterized protein n=1 Tax=Dendrothele bispora (strain CBS 962.96) TaxID=1314807 RepID=A0A4S8LUL1_DENBC|nr:hypothetical protein K435DRAFT_799864 [Dendrothele bispora CBS 962.96]
MKGKYTIDDDRIDPRRKDHVSPPEVSLTCSKDVALLVWERAIFLSQTADVQEDILDSDIDSLRKKNILYSSARQNAGIYLLPLSQWTGMRTSFDSILPVYDPHAIHYSRPLDGEGEKRLSNKNPLEIFRITLVNRRSPMTTVVIEYRPSHDVPQSWRWHRRIVPTVTLRPRGSELF